MKNPSLRSGYARSALVTVALAFALAAIADGPQVAAQQPQAIAPEALAQIEALTAEKAARTPEQRKINSQLLYASRMARGQAIAAGVAKLEVHLPDVNAQGAVLDVRVDVSQPVLDQFVALGAEIYDVSVRYRNVRLRIDLNQVEALAAIPEVSFIQPKQEALTNRIDRPTGAMPASRPESARAARARQRLDRTGTLGQIQRAMRGQGWMTSVGSQASQGDSKHNASSARAMFGVNGTGVKIGVLSDGVTSLATSQGLGDLPNTVVVLPGQAGTGDEGTAMLEIIHDLAPGAELYFATAFTSIASFAQNIRNLRAAGCDIIVDDVGYFVETPFQDGQTVSSQTNGGIVIQAVKDVTASGALYFSSAANSGNKNDGQSGTWEGNFLDGGAGTGPLAAAGQLHDFGGQTFNVLNITTSNPISLFWADPLGASANDYDIFRLNSTGTAVVGASTGFQNGTQDPFEIMTGGGSANQRIVIAKFAGAARFLHLNTNRNRLSISTAGETHGHAATSAPNSFGVAATSAQINGLNPYNSTHVVETFSSDGPRRIFFQANGTPITPGNFTATGGQVLQKPDITAADGVSVTGVGGFPSPFYGTSASAPHAAAIAALVKSRFPARTASQIKAALLASAIDIEAPGIDRDSGYGIIMADVAVGLSEPTSGNDAYTTPYQTPLSIAAPGVLGNDNSHGAAMTAAVVTGPASGTLALDANGGFLYTPNNGLVGNDSFTYRATNPIGPGAPATVTITVGPPPAPTSANDTFTTPYQTTLSIAAPGVLGNDNGNGGGAMTAAVVTGPASGTLGLNVNGGFSYTPNSGFSGADGFTYRATTTAGGPGNVATVTISVGPPLPPSAVDDAYTTPFQTALSISAPGVLGNDNSNGGGAMTAVVVAGPASGALALNANGGFSYTPNSGFAGSDSFTYRGTNAGGPGNAATVTIAVAEPTTPQPPGGLYVSSVTGNVVRLRWTPSPIGPPPTAFVVEGGLTPGSVLGSLATGSTAPVFTFVAPTGSFFVRVHQVSGADRSPASNEIRLHVNVPVPPSAPDGLLAAVSGSSLSLAWRNTFGGGEPASMLLDVTGSFQGSIPLAVTSPVSFPVVPGGTYTLSLRASNAGGASGPSNAVTVTVPGGCTGAPLPPANFLFYTVGNVATALWDPAASGAAPSGYVVNVSGTFNVSIPTSLGIISGAVPPGTYTMTVVATNACGASAPTLPQTITVP